MGELLPCPVCGDQPKWRGSRHDYAAGIYRLQCIGETHLFQAYGPSEAKCIEHWNTRTPDTHITRLESDVAIARAALEWIANWEPRAFDFPADWHDQIEACEECQRYAGHPIQAGICDTHRRPLWDRQKHDDNQRELRGLYARDHAREALSRISSGDRAGSGAPADAVQALVSDQAASRLAPSGFDPSRGTLGVDLIRWEVRAQYEWSKNMEDEYPDWDQCTTFWVDALTREEAISKGWDQHFGDHVSRAVVRPVSVASCTPLHFVGNNAAPSGETPNA